MSTAKTNLAYRYTGIRNDEPVTGYKALIIITKKKHLILFKKVLQGKIMWFFFHKNKETHI